MSRLSRSWPDTKQRKKLGKVVTRPLTLSLVLTLTLTINQPGRLHRVASEEAAEAAVRVQYDLDQLGKKSEQRLQKLAQQVREQAVDCARLEVLQDQRIRDISMGERERDKEKRQMSIERADLTRQQELTVARSARLAHDQRLLHGATSRMKRSLSATKTARVQEKKVSFLFVMFAVCCRT